MTSATTVRNIAFVIFAIFVVKTAVYFAPDASLSRTYNIYGTYIAPNVVTTILFDFRGYDTLGECVILVSGVLAVSMLFGRGLLTGDSHAGKLPELKSTPILAPFSKAFFPLLVALGLYLTLGGHITPGGGFQGGSIIAAGIFMAVVLAGRKAINFDHETLVKMESLGLSIYLILGLAGWAMAGFFLYNIGADTMDLVGPSATYLNYPDNYQAGIIPYLNIAVLIKVSAGLTTALLILMEAKKK